MLRNNCKLLCIMQTNGYSWFLRKQQKPVDLQMGLPHFEPWEEISSFSGLAVSMTDFDFHSACFKYEETDTKLQDLFL